MTFSCVHATHTRSVGQAASGTEHLFVVSEVSSGAVLYRLKGHNIISSWGDADEGHDACEIVRKRMLSGAEWCIEARRAKDGKIERMALPPKPKGASTKQSEREPLPSSFWE